MGGLRIFEADPDAKREPQKEYTRPEYAFQFRTGMKRGKRGVSLSKWRVLAGPEVAAGIAELMGGTAEEFDATKEMSHQVLTDSTSVEVVINGSDAIEDKLIQWGANNLPVHECDGMYSLLAIDRGEPCGCPPLLSQKKDRARAGVGPGPSISVAFTLAGAGEDLGTGKLIGTAWTFAESIHEVKDALDAVGGPALCRLEIVHVEYMSDVHGKVSYYKPVITVLGSYNDAIAEER